MYCSECGAKIKKGAAFCEKCGSPVPKEKRDLEDENKENEEPRKKMSKGKKIGLFLLLLIVLLLVGGYVFLDHYFSPEKMASKYLDAWIQNDNQKIYDLLDLGNDKTFVSYEIFKEVFEEEQEALKDISNYTIKKIDYSDGGLTAKVLIGYTVKDRPREEEIEIDLVKAKEKKLYLFDDWQVVINTENFLAQDYAIKVPKGSSVTLDNIKLTDTYLDQNDSSEINDIYTIPKIFTKEITIEVETPYGIKLTKKTVPSSEDVFELDLNVDDLSDEMKNTLTEKIKTDLNAFYKNVLDKKNWDSIKENYIYNELAPEDLKKAYQKLYEDITEEESTPLKSFTVTEVKLSDISLTTEGKFEVEARISYNYTVGYDKDKTHESKNAYTSTFTYDYFEEEYKLSNISRFVTYFSIYF